MDQLLLSQTWSSEKKHVLNSTLFLPFRDLQSLDLSFNYINGCIPNSGFEAWSSLRKLELLDLSENYSFDVLQIKELCKMINLQELDLSQTEFTGDLPSCMRNLTSLIFLDLSQNHFQIKFPNSIFTDMMSLKYLSLSGNQLKGTLFLNSFSNHCKLKILKLSSQSNNFRVETEFPMANPLFQLEGLELPNSNLNYDTRVFPTFLLNQHELYYLDLSNNNLTGSFPNCLIENNINLLSLNLTNNFFTGMLVLPSRTNSSLLDASQDELFGELRNDTQRLDQGEFMTESISGYIEGDTRSYIKGDVHSYFQGIDLSSNLLEGSIPEEIENMKWILELNLSNNRITGKIPKSLSNVSDLEILDLSHNDLTGQIPVELANLPLLASFSVAYNNLSGAIIKRGQFDSFPNSSFEGNPNLCGPPLATICPTASPASPNGDGTENSKNKDDWFDLLMMVGSFVVSYVLGFWGFIFVISYKRNWNRALCLAVDKYTNLFLVRITLLTRRLRTADQL